MKHLILILTSLLLTSLSVKSQTYELGVFTGGSNFIGDVGSTKYIDPTSLAYGGIFKWNRSPRHSFRASFLKSNIKSSDHNSLDPRRKARNYNFTQNITEISTGIEFNFTDFDLHSYKSQFSFYLYSGLNFLTFEEYYLDPILNTLKNNDSKNWALSIPITIGLKTRLSHNLILGFEAGVRYAFTDALDGNKPKNKDINTNMFGNTNSNDWYTFTGLTLTYAFGKKPCFCNF